MRSFLSALATSPVLIALVASFTTVQAVKEGIVPAAVVVIGALLVGLSSLALGYSERWRNATQTPLAKGIAQALQYFAAGVLTITVASIDPDVLFNVGDSIVALISASVLSGILTAGLGQAQRPAMEPTNA
jgi:hypothetical protein